MAQIRTGGPTARMDALREMNDRFLRKAADRRGVFVKTTGGHYAVKSNGGGSQMPRPRSAVNSQPTLRVDPDRVAQECSENGSFAIDVSEQ